MEVADRSTSYTVSQVTGNVPRERIPAWVYSVGALLIFGGAAVVYAGATIEGLDSYWQSVLVNVGTAIGLAGPLFLAERLFAIRIRKVGITAQQAERSAVAAEQASRAAEETSRAALSDVEELRREFLAGLARTRELNNELANHAAAGSFDALVDLYNQAARGRSIDRRGLRVRPPGWEQAVLKVRAISGYADGTPDPTPIRVLEIATEDDELNPGATVTWSPGESASEVFIRLAQGMMDARQYPGDDAVEPMNVLSTLSTQLRRIIDFRAGQDGESQVREIIEVVNGHWAVTRQGLDNLQDPSAFAEHHELADDSRFAWQRLKARWESLGGRPSEFAEAFGLAERIHQALDRQRLPRLGEWA